MHPPDAAIRAAHLSLRLQAAQHLSSLPSSRLLCLPLSGGCGAAIPLAVPERPLPATPDVGPLASESAVPTLLR